MEGQQLPIGLVEAIERPRERPALDDAVEMSPVAGCNTSSLDHFDRGLESGSSAKPPG